MNFKQKAQAGFTLIELMIVVAIIGILAAVAIPQYSNYTIKSKIAAALATASAVKTAVGVCIQEQGGEETGCNSGVGSIVGAKAAAGGTGGFVATKEVADISVTNGEITLTLGTGIGTNVDGGIIKMTPEVTDAAIIWENTAEAPLTNPVAVDAVQKNNKA